MILVPFETSDWGFGQDKFNFLKKILCVCIRLVYHLYVSCLHALGMPQRKKKKKTKKTTGKLHQLFANERCIRALFKVRITFLRV